MRLKAYLAENELSLKEFSEMIDCHYSYLSTICNGAKIPGKRLAKDIERATGGLVKFDISKNVESKQSVNQ